MEVKTFWLSEITKILWKQAMRNKGRTRNGSELATLKKRSTNFYATTLNIADGMDRGAKMTLVSCP